MSAAGVSSRYGRKAVPMGSQQHGCLNKTDTMALPVGMPIWDGENIPRLLFLDEEQQAANGCHRKENLLSPGMSLLMVYLTNPKRSARNRQEEGR